MSTSIARTGDESLAAHGPGPVRAAEGPAPGRNVPDDPGVHAMRGVVWSVTVARVALVPVFLVAAMRLQDLTAQGVSAGPLRWGLVLTLAVIAASDMLDGWLARRFGLASQAGAIADALADKLVQVGLVAFFTLAGGPAFAELPLWFLALVLGRDLALGAGWLALRSLDVSFPVVHRIHGRAATAAVFAVLFWVTAGLEGEGIMALLLLTAALIWVSVAGYAAQGWMAWRAPPQPLVTPPSEGGIA